MTWIMFGNKLMCPDTGAYFSLDRIESYTKEVWFDLRYYRVTSTTDFFSESYETEEQAQARFLELQKMLIKEPEQVIGFQQYKFDPEHLKIALKKLDEEL